ncbi:MAG: PAS domain S-box protein [Nitrospinae bacterium]|nr:PAS domain S-box protein [Nitrospinota bacterium]
MFRLFSKLRFGLKAKLIFAMMTAGILPLVVGMLLSHFQGNKSLRDVIGGSFQALAQSTANKIDFVIDKEIAKNLQVVLQREVRSAVENQNETFRQMEKSRLEERLSQADREWRENGPLANSLMANAAADILHYHLQEPSHSAESTRAFYITDARGALVASINNVPPFLFRDEAVRKKAGERGVYLGGISWDEKLEEYVFRMVLPILSPLAQEGQIPPSPLLQKRGEAKEEGEARPVIGLLHRVYSVKTYFAPPLESIRFGDTGHVMIVDGRGVVIDCPILPTGFRIPNRPLVAAVTLPESGWARTQGNGHGAEQEESIIGFSPLSNVNKILVQSAKTSWHMFAWQASDELFAPARKFLLWNAFAGGLGVLLILLIGGYFANKIITPIRKLQSATADLGRYFTQSPASVPLAGRAPGSESPPPPFGKGGQGGILQGGESSASASAGGGVAPGGVPGGGTPVRLAVEIDTRDEIGDLAVAFTQMAGDLETARASERERMAELERLLVDLDASETRLASIMNNVAEGIVTIDERGIVESVNPAMERIFGYQAEELLGKSVNLLMPEPYKSEHDGYIRNYLKTGQAKVLGLGRELVGLRKDGTVFPIDLAVSEMWIGEKKFFVAAIRDITERKKNEGELRKLSRAVEQSPSGVLITDIEGNIEYVNPNFVETSGYSYEEIIGKNPRILKSGVHPPQFYSKLWETITAGNEWRGEFCNRKKDGKLFWELQSISPLRDAEGRITHFLAVKIDDTERKRAEEQLKQYAAELERSNEALRDFAAIASHDLQEPLRKIVSFGDRLKEYGQVLDERAKDYLERMQVSTQRMQKFIYDLLEYSKVATKPKQFEPLDLKELITDVLIDLETRTKQTQGQVIVAALPVIEGDKMQLRQLFLNLIGNALKFHRKDAPPHVEIRSRFTIKGFWEIAVTDNGIGFDMKYLDRIFKPFQRLHGRTEYEGSGMGLAICQKIVTGHNGRFTARSALGKGSQFIIQLPEKQIVKPSDPILFPSDTSTNGSPETA